MQKYHRGPNASIGTRCTRVVWSITVVLAETLHAQELCGLAWSCKEKRAVGR